AGALGPDRILGRLHDDLLSGLQQVGDLWPAAAPAAPPAPGRLAVGRDDLVDVQEAVLLEPDVDERRLHARKHVVHAALVDVAGDRAPPAPFYVKLGDTPGVRSGGRLGSASGLRRALPARARSTTRGGRRALAFEYRDPGLPTVDRDQYL